MPSRNPVSNIALLINKSFKFEDFYDLLRQPTEQFTLTACASILRNASLMIKDRKPFSHDLRKLLVTVFERFSDSALMRSDIQEQQESAEILVFILFNMGHIADESHKRYFTSTSLPAIPVFAAGSLLNIMLGSKNLQSKNISSSLNGLGRLAEHRRLEGRLNSRLLDDLLTRLNRCRDIDAQALSNSLHSLGRLAEHGHLEAHLDVRLLGALLKQLTHFRYIDAQAISSSLHGLGRLAEHEFLDDPFDAQLISALLKKLNDFRNIDAQAISNSLHGLGRLAERGLLESLLDARLINALLKKLNDCRDIDAQAISNSLHGLGRLAERGLLESPLDAGLISVLLKKLNDCRDINSQAISNSLHGLGRLAERGLLEARFDARLLDVLLAKLNGCRDIHAQNISNSLYGLGRLAEHEQLKGCLDEQPLNDLLIRLNRCRDIHAQNISNSLYGLGRLAERGQLRCHPDEQLLNDLLTNLNRCDDIDLQAISNSIHAIGRLLSHQKGASSIDSSVIASLINQFFKLDPNTIDCDQMLFGLSRLIEHGLNPQEFINQDQVLLLMNSILGDKTYIHPGRAALLLHVLMSFHSLNPESDEIFNRLMDAVETVSFKRLPERIKKQLQQDNNELSFVSPFRARLQQFVDWEQASQISPADEVPEQWHPQAEAEHSESPCEIQTESTQSSLSVEQVPAEEVPEQRRPQVETEHVEPPCKKRVLSTQAPGEVQVPAQEVPKQRRPRPATERIEPARKKRVLSTQAPRLTIGEVQVPAQEVPGQQRPRPATEHVEPPCKKRMLSTQTSRLETEWQQAHQNALFQAISSKNMAGLRRLLNLTSQSRSKVARVATQVRTTSTNEAGIPMHRNSTRLRSQHEIEPLVSQFFQETSVNAMRRLARESSHAYFIPLLQACSLHGRLILIKQNHLNLIIIHLPLASLQPFITALLGDLQLYRDHRALLAFLDALTIRFDQNLGERDVIIALQKQLVAQSLEYHSKCNHQNVVQRLEDCAQRINRKEMILENIEESPTRSPVPRVEQPQRPPLPIEPMPIRRHPVVAVRTPSVTTMPSPAPSAKPKPAVFTPPVTTIPSPAPSADPKPVVLTPAVTTLPSPALSAKPKPVVLTPAVTTMPLPAPSAESKPSANPDYSYTGKNIVKLLRHRFSKLETPVMVLNATHLRNDAPGNLIEVLKQTIDNLGDAVGKYRAVVPIAVDKHWIGIKVSILNKKIVKITYFDSMTTDGPSYKETIVSLLKSAKLCSDNCHITTNKHELKQSNPSDCGPLLVENMYCDSRDHYWRAPRGQRESEQMVLTMRNNHRKLLKENEPRHATSSRHSLSPQLFFSKQKQPEVNGQPSTTSQIASSY